MPYDGSKKKSSAVAKMPAVGVEETGKGKVYTLLHQFIGKPSMAVPVASALQLLRAAALQRQASV